MPICTAVASLTVIMAAAQAAAEPVSLAAHPEPGDAMRYEQLQFNRTMFAGRGQEVNTRLRFGLAFAEPADPADPMPTTMTVEGIAIDIAQPGGRAFFDSDLPPSDEPNPLGPALAPLIGSEILLNVSNGGQVSDITIGAEGQTQAAAMAGLAPNAVFETVNRLLDLPQAPASLEVGDRWTWVRRDTLNPTTTVSVAHDMLVESIDNGLITITFNGGASVSFSEPASEDAPARPSLEDSEISGRIVWDANAGCAASWKYFSSLGLLARNAQDPTQQQLLRIEYTLQVDRLDD